MAADPSPRVIESAPGTLRQPAIRRLNASILNRGSIQANTVPSGHAAGAVATALAVADVMPVAGVVFLLLAGAIVAATVLGRYHYLVDSLLGVVVALGAWGLCRCPRAPLPLKRTAAGARPFRWH